MLNDSGLDYRLSLVPLKRLLIEVERNPKDCLFIARTVKSTELFRFIEPTGLSVSAGVIPGERAAGNETNGVETNGVRVTEKAKTIAERVGFYSCRPPPNDQL